MIQRYYYKPTPSQRVEVMLAAKALRHRVERLRRERAELAAIQLIAKAKS